MRIRTLLNRGERFKSFIYSGIRLTTVNGADASRVSPRGIKGRSLTVRGYIFKEKLKFA